MTLNLTRRDALVGAGCLGLGSLLVGSAQAQETSDLTPDMLARLHNQAMDLFGDALNKLSPATMEGLLSAVTSLQEKNYLTRDEAATAQHLIKILWGSPNLSTVVAAVEDYWEELIKRKASEVSLVLTRVFQASLQWALERLAKADWSMIREILSADFSGLLNGISLSELLPAKFKAIVITACSLGASGYKGFSYLYNKEEKLV